MTIHMIRLLKRLLSSFIGVDGDEAVREPPSRGVPNRPLRESVEGDSIPVEKTTVELRDTSEKFLTVEQTAHLLHRSSYTIRRWIRNERLEVSRPSGGDRSPYLIRRAAVDKLLKEPRT